MRRRELLSAGRALAAELRLGWLPTAVLLAFAALALASGRPLLLQLLPALAWAGAAWLFGRTLRAEQSLIERLARIVEPTAPDFIGPWCRLVTALHAALFAAIAAWIAGLAIDGDEAAWRTFVGLEAWGLLAVFEVGELLARKLHFRRYGRNPVDHVLARLFPAERTAAGRRSLAHLRRLAEQDATKGGHSTEIPAHGAVPSE